MRTMRNSQALPGGLALALSAWVGLAAMPCFAAETTEVRGLVQFRKDIQPVLQEFCHDCHGDGSDKGGITLDTFTSDRAMLDDHEL